MRVPNRIPDGDHRGLPSPLDHKVSELGTITIEVSRYKMLGIIKNVANPYPMDIPEGRVSEKAIKGRALTLRAG
jgi:hypothetical protein